MHFFKKLSLRHTSKYEDLVVRLSVSLIAAHVICSFRQKVGFFLTPTLPNYFPALLSSFITFLAIFYVINRLNRYFDEKYPWEPHHWRRLSLQVGFCMVLPFLVAFTLAAAYFACFGRNIFKTTYFETYVLPILLFELLINFYYNSAFIASLTDRSLIDRKDKIKTGTDTAKEKKQLHIKKQLSTYEPVLFFCSKNLCSAKTISGENIYWGFGLKDTMEALSSNEYFAINRHCIVKRDAIAALHPRDSGQQLKLILKKPLKDRPEVSVRQAVDFSNWWFNKT